MAMAEVLASLGLLRRESVRLACRFLLPYLLIWLLGLEVSPTPHSPLESGT